MAMNDGIPFLDDYGTIVEPPRGKDNPYFEDDQTEEDDG